MISILNIIVKDYYENNEDLNTKTFTFSSDIQIKDHLAKCIKITIDELLMLLEEDEDLADEGNNFCISYSIVKVKLNEVLEK